MKLHINPTNSPNPVPVTHSLNSIEEIFSLASQLLRDAFKINLQRFLYPYEIPGQFDAVSREFRQQQYIAPVDFLKSFSKNTNVENYRLFIIKTPFDFYHVTSVLPHGEHPDIISAGPFRDHEFTAAFHPKISREHKITLQNTSVIREFYQSLPLAEPYNVANMLRHFLTAFFPEFQSVPLQLMDYSQPPHDITQDSNLLDLFTLRYAETYSEYLQALAHAIRKGDCEAASENLAALINLCGITIETPVLLLRKFLMRINTHCADILFGTKLHPVHILQIQHTFDNRIESENVPAILFRMAHEIVRKYCLLIKNDTCSEYSYLIRNVINYITQHISLDLSLNSIAEYFHKNPSYLSGQFSSEVGVSLTSYIHQEKIREAIRYFNTHDLPVSEVASAVGIHDYSYFSKLFKNETGCSPSQYKKLLWRQNHLVTGLTSTENSPIKIPSKYS